MIIRQPNERLKGKRILVVEDTLLVAQEIEILLERLGCEVVGPIPDLEAAAIAAREAEVDGALLDVNLSGELVWPAAAGLRERGVPFAFMTGYGVEVLPPEFTGWPHLEKPFGTADFERLLERLLEPVGGGSAGDAAAAV